MEPKSQMKLFGTIALGVIGIIGAFAFLGVVQIEGNEAAVRQNWQIGVLRAVNADGTVKYEDVYRDGTHFYFPRIAWDIHVYDIGLQKLTMDSNEENPESEYPSLKLAVGSGGGQKVTLSGSIVYMIGHRNVEGTPEFAPDLLVELHNSGNGRNYESVILKRVWQEVVTSIATTQEAMTLYSGVGFEQFRQDVDKALKNHHVLMRRGIFVESTIMYPVRLDPRYEQEISDKQLATQTKLKEKELQLAAEARALKVEAEKQADVVAAAQAAEAKKQAMMKKAEAKRYEAEQAAEAERFRQEQEAIGVLAMKTAEAEGQRQLTIAMYGGQAGARRFKVEFGDVQAKALVGMLAGVQVITDKALVQLINDPSVGSVKVTVPVGE